MLLVKKLQLPCFIKVPSKYKLCCFVCLSTVMLICDHVDWFTVFQNYTDNWISLGTLLFITATSARGNSPNFHGIDTSGTKVMQWLKTSISETGQHLQWLCIVINFHMHFCYRNYWPRMTLNDHFVVFANKKNWKAHTRNFWSKR